MASTRNPAFSTRSLALRSGSPTTSGILMSARCSWIMTGILAGKAGSEHLASLRSARRSCDLLADALDHGDVDEMDQLLGLEPHVVDGDALVLVVDRDRIDHLDAGDVLDDAGEVALVDRAAEGPALAV